MGLWQASSRGHVFGAVTGVKCEEQHEWWRHCEFRCLCSCDLQSCHDVEASVPPTVAEASCNFSASSNHRVDSEDTVTWKSLELVQLKQAIKNEYCYVSETRKHVTWTCTYRLVRAVWRRREKPTWRRFLQLREKVTSRTGDG